MGIIYLSGPISNAGADGAKKMYQNVRNGEELMFKLMKKGWTVVCPHLTYYAWLHWEESIGWETWIKHDLEVIDRCDALFYMEPKKWGESKGALLELEHANKKGIKVYTEMNDVPTLE